jgi:hypothetical protein
LISIDRDHEISETSPFLDRTPLQPGRWLEQIE